MDGVLAGPGRRPKGYAPEAGIGDRYRGNVPNREDSMGYGQGCTWEANCQQPVLAGNQSKVLSVGSLAWKGHGEELGLYPKGIWEPLKDCEQRAAFEKIPGGPALWFSG